MRFEISTFKSTNELFFLHFSGNFKKVDCLQKGYNNGVVVFVFVFVFVVLVVKVSSSFLKLIQNRQWQWQQFRDGSINIEYIIITIRGKKRKDANEK